MGGETPAAVRLFTVKDGSGISPIASLNGSSTMVCLFLDWLVILTGAIAMCEESDGRTKNAPYEQNIWRDGYTGEP